MKIQRLLVIAVVGIAALAAVGYYWLGGFNDLVVQTIKVNNYYMVGKKLKTKTSNPLLDDFFDQIRKDYEQGRLQGQFGIVWFANPDLAGNDSVEVMAGVLADTAFTAPEGYQTLLIPAQSAVRAQANSRAAVMPNPAKVNERIRKYAQANALTVSDFIIEIYDQDGKVVTEVPVGVTR